MFNGIEACVCSADSFLASDGGSCITACPAGQFLSINGERCVTSCASMNAGDSNNDGQCDCLTTFPFININGDGCTAACNTGANEALDLAGRQCVQNTCGTN